MEAARVLLASLDSKDFATQAKQDSQITLLSSLDSKDFATQTTLELIRLLLVSLDGKDYSTETTLALIKPVLDTIKTDTVNLDVALSTRATEATLAAIKAVTDQLTFTGGDLNVNASVTLPAGLAIEAKQDDQITLSTAANALLTSLEGKDFATQTTLEAVRVLIASLDGKDHATETTLALIKPVLDNIKLDTANLDVALSTRATEATLELTRLLLASIDGKDFATETTLAAIKTQTDKLTFTVGDLNVNSTPNAASKEPLSYDAWNRPKSVNDNSIFHGMFTYNVPITTWYETVNGVEGAITNSTSVDGSLNVLAGATLNDETCLRSYRNPRYEPNRGALYSTAGWFTNPTALMTREFGTFTAESGVFFRLKSGGTLVGVIRTTTTAGGTVDTEYSLTIPVGVDLSKNNVFDIQYQWRGAGDYKWFINLQEVANSNTLGTLTQLSMFNPALPAAWNSINLGDNSPMNFGCVDITSEGGKDNGKTYGSVNINNQSGQVSISGTGNFNIPIIAIRSKATVGGLINTRDTLALLASAYADQRSIIRVWATRDNTAITVNDQSWVDFGDGHLEYIQYDNPPVTNEMTFDTSKATLIFGARVGIDLTYATSALFEGRTEIYLTPNDTFIFTMHRETGAAVNCGVTFEFCELI